MDLPAIASKHRTDVIAVYLSQVLEEALSHRQTLVSLIFRHHNAVWQTDVYRRFLNRNDCNIAIESRGCRTRNLHIEYQLR